MCITSLEKSERRLRLIGYYHRQKKEKFDGPETGSPRTTDRDIRFNILIVAKTILEREARDSRKFQGVDITVWNLLLAEIWEYVLTDLIVKIIVIKSGPLKIIRYTEIALKNWPNFENYCLPQNFCKILSKWIQFWIEKSFLNFLESTNVSKFCSNENRFSSLQKFPPSIQLGKATCSNQTKPHLLSKHRIQKAFSKDQCVTSSLPSPSFVRISRKWSPPIASIITGFILGRLVQPFPPLRPRDE